MTQISIYTDGACRGNPGPGGYGCILRYVGPDGKIYEKELSAGFEATTNNRMEILAAVVALEALKRPCEIQLYSDSQYLVNAFRQGWLARWKKNAWFRDAKRREKVKNVDLWQRLEQVMQPHQVSFHWVKGHADNPFNNRCDEMAVQAALDKENRKIGEGFVQEI